MNITGESLARVIKRFKGKKILVVGDLILDHYIFGEVDRVSPEAPVPVVWANTEKFVGGGAVNVALNLIELGAEVYLCGVIGDGHYGKVLLSLIKDKNINTSLIIHDKNRPTTLKTRIVAQHQQVVRLDWESKDFLSPEVNSRVLNKIKKEMDSFDGIIIEDYGKGVINPELVDVLVRESKNKEKVVTVDPKEEHFDYYQNVTAMTPNLKEAQIAAGMKIRSLDDVDLVGSRIMHKLQPKALLVTMGESGMKLFQEDGKTYHIPTYALEVYDVTGAGDTVISVYTLSLASGASFVEAAVISNCAAGIVVEKLGAATTTKPELMERVKSEGVFKIKG